MNLCSPSRAPAQAALFIVFAAAMAMALAMPIATSARALAQDANNAVPAVPTAATATAADEASEKSIDIAEVEAQLAKLKADSEIGDAVKTTLTPKLEKALDLLKVALTHQKSAEAFRSAVQSAPGETAAASGALDRPWLY